ncbi:IS21-like element helper ATPase IstB [Niveibacterium sp. SC-1]|uniref:IS21-like element helper ATPase IstB n=1 Tax=Niveibacterium sp. SC-1 TaxID=3135646 RepID=UPI00311E4708
MTQIQQTATKLRGLKLTGMAGAYVAQVEQPRLYDFSFDERLAMIVDAELTTRENRKLRRIIAAANFPERAVIEDLDAHPARGLDPAFVAFLANGDWIRLLQNLILIGPTGVGKTWLICALAMQACRRGESVLFRRCSELYGAIALSLADGTAPKLKLALAKPALLILDDLGLGGIPEQVAGFLLDVIDRRQHRGSLAITSQFPIERWHGFFADPSMAEAILDRVVHQAHRLNMQGESLRKAHGAARLGLGQGGER